MAKINYNHFDEEEYFPKAEKIKKKKSLDSNPTPMKPKTKFKKQVKRFN